MTVSSFRAAELGIGLDIANISVSWSYFILAAALMMGFYSYQSVQGRRSNFPIVNYDPRAWTDASAKAEFTMNCKKLLREGSKKFTGPFRLITHNGPLVLLPASLVDAMNAEKNLSSVEYFKEEFLSEFQTFRSFRPPPPGMVNNTLRQGITRRLPKLSKPLSREMASALQDTFGQQDDFSEKLVLASVNMWITRLVNMVLLGEGFSRNKEWVRITAGYTYKLFPAINALRSFHPWLRPVVDYFAPANRAIRADQEAIAGTLMPVIEERRKEIESAKAEGRTPNLPDDSLEWFRSSSRGRAYENIWTQLGLLQVAIQTTSDVLTQSILHLCAYPEYVEPLRKEIVDVIQKHGMSKEGLSELRLLDSFIKESLRLKPVTMASMHRRAMKDVELPGGVRIREGEHLAISSHLMWDEAHYDNPDTFNGFRFAERRAATGNDTKNLLVSTSVDHLGFAHGKLACPGRFLAAEMLKVAMVHLVMKYDMKIQSRDEARWWTYGEMMMPKDGAKMFVKSRVPEIDLGAFEAE